MTRTAWGPGELRGYATVWLVEVAYGGSTIRMASRTVDLDSGAGPRAYEGTIDDLAYSRSLDLFSLQAESPSLVVEGATSVDVPTLQVRGHRLEGCAVEVSQVRVDRDGNAVDEWEDRCVRLTGVVRDAQWGPYGGGGCKLRFSAERMWWRTTAKIPTPKQQVSRDTWPIQGNLNADDSGVAYPIVIGYPGNDPLDQDGGFPAYRGVWLSKLYTHQLLGVGLGKIAATQVHLTTDSDVYGSDVLVSQEWEGVPATDRRGAMLSVVDYGTNDYGTPGDPAYLGASFALVTTDTTPVYIWHTEATGGGILRDGEVLRGAGDVLAWAMERSGVPFDAGRFQAAAGALNDYLIDFAFTESVPAWEWVTEELLPLLPVSLVPGERGVYPVPWRQDIGRADCVAVIDADADPRIDPAEMAAEDSASQVTSWTLRYGYNARTDKLRYTRRVGPFYEDSTDVASAEVRSSVGAMGDVVAVALYATTAGLGGVGISVSVSFTGAATSAVESVSARLITININNGGGVLSSDIVTACAGLTLVTAEAVDDSSGPWVGISTTSLTLTVNDFGTSAHPASLRGYQQMRAARMNPADESEAEVSTALIYDHATAWKVLAWKAAAYGSAQRRVSMMVPESEYAHLDLGDPFVYTDSALGFSEEIGIVEGLDLYSDGSMGIRGVFIDR